MVEVAFERRVYGGRRHRDTRVYRLVGVYDEARRGYRLYLTSIPVDRLDARDVAETYRLRWQVELLFKELKTHHRLDQLPSARRDVVEALVYASILSLAASRALLDALRQRLPDGRCIPPLRWAAVFEVIAPALLTAVLARCGHRQQAIDPNLDRPIATVENGLYL